MPELKNYLLGDYRDTVNYINMISRKGLAQFPPMIVSVAITGGLHGAEANPNLPETPEQQVQSAYDAYNAGASLVHIHARDPKNWSLMSQSSDDFLKVNSLVREKCPDIIINNTCIGGRNIDIDKEKLGSNLLASLPAKPEVASVDLAAFSSIMKMGARKPPLTGRDRDVTARFNYFMDLNEAEMVVKTMEKYEVKPELELFDLGNVKYINELIRRDVIKAPYWIQMLFGGNGFFPAADYMLGAANLFPKDALFSIIGIGGCQTAMVTLAMILGHHVRVGLEDNVFYAPGELAKSNAQLVERVVRIARELGRPIATPAQAREMMGLGSPRPYVFNK